MGLILKVIVLNIVVFGGIWLYRELRNAPLRDGEGNPIPTPKEGQGNEEH